MDETSVHGVTAEYFTSIFNGTLPAEPNLVMAVDDLLDRLVTRFDDEELPLRQDEQVLELIIDEGGDKNRALQRADTAKEALTEQVSFTQLLTNAAMNPEVSGASRATQRYAISLSKDWISHAHGDITAMLRVKVPLDVELMVDGWNGKTRNGENEKEMLASMDQFLVDRMEKALAAVTMQVQHFAVGGVGALFLLYGVFQLGSQGSSALLPVLIGLAMCGWVAYEYMQEEPRKVRIREEFEKKREAGAQIIRAICAEVVDYRRTLALLDSRAAEVEAVLAGVSPDQHAMGPYDTARGVLK